jgi:hypothetical protein
MPRQGREEKKRKGRRAEEARRRRAAPAATTVLGPGAVSRSVGRTRERARKRGKRIWK